MKGIQRKLMSKTLGLILWYSFVSISLNLDRLVGNIGNQTCIVFGMNRPVKVTQIVEDGSLTTDLAATQQVDDLL